MRPDLRLLLPIVLLPLMAGAAVPEAGRYAYSFKLHTSARADAHRLRFTPEIYAASWPRADLRDIVVVNANGEMVPFGALPARSTAGPFKLERPLLPLPDSAEDDNRAIRVLANVEPGQPGFIVLPGADRPRIAKHPGRWLVDAGRQVRLRHIDLEVTPSDPDFELQLAVETSKDLQHWRSAVRSASVLSLINAEGGVQRLRIPMSQQAARYYRLRIVDGKPPWSRNKPPSVTLIGTTVPVEVPAEPLQSLTLQSEPVDAPARTFEYRLPALLPVESLQLVLPGTVGAANLQVSTRDPFSKPERWRVLASVTAIRARDRTSGEASFPPRRASYLRVRSDTALPQPPQLRVSWRPDVFVFLAQGAGPYRLLAGSRMARRGRYPVAAALGSLRRDRPPGWQPPFAAVGPRSQAAGPAALEPPFDWTRLLLWAVLVAGAVLVIALGISLLRQRGQGAPD